MAYDLMAYLVARYKDDQARDREVIAEIDAGLRHYTHDGTSVSMVDVTDELRAKRLAHIEMLDEAIRRCSKEQFGSENDAA